ncbi:uncharacterized protein LOC122066646 [Macadamia integrifolia]|uniref:uncharacterized protein LOC122066646 n=1 Tax=Macadamia integrifolia TaxID=60698 RepID=UPI001C4E5C43|nr:uncharacterized protein LOC122066646 [Macadamia integrifolia]
MNQTINFHHCRDRFGSHSSNSLAAILLSFQMASRRQARDQDERAGAEIVKGTNACHRHSMELLQELGFPKGVLPLQELEECGRVRETGFVWMKSKAPYEHFFVATNTRVSYATEVTAYVEKGKMKKMTGIKSKQMLLWIPVTEMCIIQTEQKEEALVNHKIHFKTPMGIGKYFPISAFMTQEEKNEYLQIQTKTQPQQNAVLYMNK